MLYNFFKGIGDDRVSQDKGEDKKSRSIELSALLFSFL
jgi:hypothetical protein